MSFPRDTYVDIPGHGHNLLNAAFELGGAALTIQTFQDVFGIPIQHYLAVNFVGFEKIVNAIGHVKIYFPTPARDFYSQLDQPSAGCHSLDGAEALAYARSRHYSIPREGVSDPDPQNRDDWIEDPRSDLDRIQRQQYFLRSLGQTALEHGASNPITAVPPRRRGHEEPHGRRDARQPGAEGAGALVRRSRSRDGRDDDAARDGRHERRPARRAVSRSATDHRPAEGPRRSRRRCRRSSIRRP